MPPIMVGLLAAVATAVPALIPFAHGYLILVIVLEAAAAAGLVAICTAPDQGAVPDQDAPSDQKNLLKTDIYGVVQFVRSVSLPTCYHLAELPPEASTGSPRVSDWLSSCGGFAARVSGLAFGLALAVRPAGSAEVSRVNGAPEARPA